MNEDQLITMNSKEIRHYDVIRELINNKINGTDASKQLRLSVRQVKRMKAKVLKEGMKGLINGNRGRKGNHQLDEGIMEKAKELLHQRYYDFNPLLAQEHLFQDDHIKASKETVRQWMINEKLWNPRKKGDIKKHVWRERKDN